MKINPKDFYSEIELRAKNNYGKYETADEIIGNIERAIVEISEEEKNEIWRQLRDAKQYNDLFDKLRKEIGVY